VVAPAEGADATGSVRGASTLGEEFAATEADGMLVEMPAEPDGAAGGSPPSELEQPRTATRLAGNSRNTEKRDKVTPT